MNKSYLESMPDINGFFGKFGGSFIPPVLEKPFDDITKAYAELKNSPKFIEELKYVRKHYQGRPTPISFAKNLTQFCGGAKIYLKREDLNHTGAHKLNHCMAEVILAKYLGKKKVIAETGAGQHGVALATAAAYFGLECEIHMGEVDIAKEHPNVVRMKILGAKVVPATHGLKTLKEAVDAFYKLSQLEGIIPALESAHAVGFAMKLAKTLPKDKTILVSLSGRGDKDIDFVIENSPIPNSEF